MNIAARPKAAHLWERHPDDFYIEERFASALLFAAERFDGVVHDPACGSGNIVLSAICAGVEAFGTDIAPRHNGKRVWWRGTRDFLGGATPPCDNFVFNPPFNRDVDFIKQALVLARRKVAAFLPANWTCGAAHARFLRGTPLAARYDIAPRPRIKPAGVVLADAKPLQRQDFAWFVWEIDRTAPPTFGVLIREG